MVHAGASRRSQDPRKDPRHRLEEAGDHGASARVGPPCLVDLRHAPELAHSPHSELADGGRDVADRGRYQHRLQPLHQARDTRRRLCLDPARLARRPDGGLERDGRLPRPAHRRCDADRKVQGAVEGSGAFQRLALSGAAPLPGALAPLVIDNHSQDAMRRSMVAVILRPSLWLALLAALTVSIPAQAATATQEVQTSWRLLDYIAVDYREAVAGGRVINPLEYDEMVEFSSSVSAKLAVLPVKPERAKLIEDARALESAIIAKTEPGDVARRSKTLAAELLAAYPVPLAPAQAPDLARGAALYAQSCASCHGGKGEGPPPQFANLDPPPIAFADRERARERSVFGLYQVITQGLVGTAMQSFAALPEADRWALAFHAGTLAYGDAAEGARIWRADSAVR